MLFAFTPANTGDKMKTANGLPIISLFVVPVLIRATYSNHIAATAYAAHLFGLKSIGIIRGEELAVSKPQ